MKVVEFTCIGGRHKYDGPPTVDADQPVDSTMQITQNRDKVDLTTVQLCIIVKRSWPGTALARFDKADND